MSVGSGKQSTNLSKVGGTAVDTNSGNKSAGTQRVVLATDQPALANALLVSESGSGKTLKTAVVSLTSSGNVIAAVSGKIIKVYSYAVQSVDDAMTVQLQDDNGGTNVTPLWTFNAREGTVEGPISPPHFLFKNAAQNKPIYATLTGSGTVKICARYWDDDAS